MPLYKADGTEWSGSALRSALTTQASVTKYLVPEAVGPIYRDRYYATNRDDQPGTGARGRGTELWKAVGDEITEAELGTVLATATVSTITPNTGSTAGGTAVTIAGTNLQGVTNVTFGGAGGTALNVVSDTEVTVTTPAHASGAVDVVVTDDSGAVTKTGAFTYA